MDIDPALTGDGTQNKFDSPNGKAQSAEELAKATLPRHDGRKPRTPLTLDPKSRALYYAMLAILHVISLLPDLVLNALGVIGGTLAYLLDRRHIKIGMTNLSIAFPDKSDRERRRILRGSYVSLGKSAAEYVRLGGFFHLRMRDRVRYERLGYWEEIARKYPGKGVIVLTAHFSNFELLLCAHAMYGFQISLVHHTQRFLAGDALMTFVRERAGVDIIRKHSAARAVLKALRDGDLVGIPFDQNAKRSEAIFVPFFGEPAATAGGVARLAMLSGVPVVPVFIIREPDGRSYRIEIQDEIPLQRTGDGDADATENTRRFVKAVEDMVRRYPEQFLWTHRRYRTRPRGMAPMYELKPKQIARRAMRMRQRASSE
jgi:Kdo2-lipid IVA lauroyltransferase/acyltransferase